MSKDIQGVAADAAGLSPSVEPASRLDGSATSIPCAVSRRELDAWLEANCGRGIPHGIATDLHGALHGLSYVLQQIEGTNSYKVFIGQCNSATSSIRWALDYFAAQAIEARSGQTACGLDPKGESAVPKGCAQ